MSVGNNDDAVSTVEKCRKHIRLADIRAGPSCKVVGNSLALRELDLAVADLGCFRDGAIEGVFLSFARRKACNAQGQCGS
jgi:hypothetical protein